MKLKTGSTSREITAQKNSAAGDKYTLRLYIAGHTSNALTAIKNLRSLCKEELKGLYNIEIIDILKKPKLGRDAQIIAIPTLMRKLPLPVKMIIGNLSDTERVLSALDINGYH
jgi:circadian clock protein KaiB